MGIDIESFGSKDCGKRGKLWDLGGIFLSEEIGLQGYDSYYD